MVLSETCAQYQSDDLKERCRCIEYQHPSFFFSCVLSSFLSSFQFGCSLLSHQILITHRSCKPQGIKCFVRDINMIFEQVLKSEEKNLCERAYMLRLMLGECVLMFTRDQMLSIIYDI